MNFRDDAQRLAVCRAVCKRMEMPELWTAEGPSAQAEELLASDGGSLPGDRRALFQLVWLLWNGREDPPLSTLLSELHGTDLAFVSELVMAISRGPRGIDEWLRRQGCEPQP